MTDTVPCCEMLPGSVDPDVAEVPSGLRPLHGHICTDWAHPAHICTGTGLTPPTAAPGQGVAFSRAWFAALPGAPAGVATEACYGKRGGETYSEVSTA